MTRPLGTIRLSMLGDDFPISYNDFTGKAPDLGANEREGTAIVYDPHNTVILATKTLVE